MGVQWRLWCDSDFFSSGEVVGTVDEPAGDAAVRARALDFSCLANLYRDGTSISYRLRAIKDLV